MRLAFCCTCSRQPWHFSERSQLVTFGKCCQWLEELIYPIDKENLDVLRFAHFLALAVVTVRFVSRDWLGLKSSWLWPPIVCGQRSLEIFCLGVFLSFAAHFAMVEVSGRCGCSSRSAR